MATKHTFIFKGGFKTKTLSGMSAIREKCLECCNWSPHEVNLYSAKDCALFPFRFGKDPGRKKKVLSEERKVELREQLKRGRKTQLKST